MLFKVAVLEQIAAGRVRLAFRRWARPTVRAGGSLRTATGVLAIDQVEEISAADISVEDAGLAGYPTRESLLSDLERGREGRLYRIAFHPAGPDPRIDLRDQADLSPDDLSALLGRLLRLDRTGPWTHRALRLIGDGEGRPAAEIAEALNLEKLATKRRIRQLKELGLTESLERGYRLSPRGRALLNSLAS